MAKANIRQDMKKVLHTHDWWQFPNMEFLIELHSHRAEKQKLIRLCMEDKMISTCPF
jgi:hypothetical protein